MGDAERTVPKTRGIYCRKQSSGEKLRRMVLLESAEGVLVKSYIRCKEDVKSFELLCGRLLVATSTVVVQVGKASVV